MFGDVSRNELLQTKIRRIFMVQEYISGDMDFVYLLGPTEYDLPEDGSRIQSRNVVFSNINRIVLDKNRTMDNVQKHNESGVKFSV
jgi:hypothetical protein